MVLTNSMYDILKWIAQYFLPSIATLYCAVAKIWGLPYGMEIAGTISAIDIFLGAILGLSSANYPGEGTLSIKSVDGVENYMMILNIPIEDVPSYDSLTFKVDHQTEDGVTSQE